ncbi:hypothetical protein B0H17DRAFT_1180375 [Mycena rosella]|uniref:Uncharacterized protein n=1 Tax=Mycena rosella TaxID=1033263 RepID=A0AAD7DDS8_MYCRO|nr:hypothetical protein B0H17DRAFT_1180375 [Mycena rosella]
MSAIFALSNALNSARDAPAPLSLATTTTNLSPTSQNHVPYPAHIHIPDGPQNHARADTFFPLADEDDEDDDYSYNGARYTLNLGAGSECASRCASACPTPPPRPSPKPLRLAPAPVVPPSWEWHAPIDPAPPSPSSSLSDSDSDVPSPSLSSCPSPSDSDSEEEDGTDYSFPALQHARARQSRRHAPHSLSAVLGLRGGLLSVARVLGCVVVVAVLAGSGRWGGEPM